MAEVGPAFYDTFKKVLGGRLYTIANEPGSTALHAERIKIAKHVLEDWDGAVRQLLCVYISNWAGQAEDDGTVGANLDIAIDTMARVGAWGP